MERTRSQNTPASPAPRWQQQGDRYSVSTRSYTLVLSTVDGSIIAFQNPSSRKTLLRSGEYGLWYIRFRSGATLAGEGMPAQAQIRQNRLVLQYEHPRASVTVQAVAHAEYVDWVGEVRPRADAVLDFALPARLRFSPDDLSQLVCPMDGNQGVGIALRGEYFEQQPQHQPSAWQHTMSGPKGYARLFGAPLDQHADNDPPTPIFPADDARRWLPEEVVASLAGSMAIVNRPSRREQLDVALVDSPNGVYFGGRRMGAGILWRTGGRVESAQRSLVLSLVMGVLEKLGTQGRVGLIALKNAPRSGGWSAVTIDDWQARLAELQSATQGRIQSVLLDSLPALQKALQEGSLIAIINPYGEWLPSASADLTETLQAIQRFVEQGGHWFETGGYPFYYALYPARYFSMRVTYPPAFADFLHWDCTSGSASLLRVQPRTWKAWDRRNLFVPGWLAWGGDENGGYAERAFGTCVTPGSSWRAPTVRLLAGKSAPQALRLYEQANQMRRRLADKMPRPLLEQFKRAVLIYYAGNAREKTLFLSHLPVPSLVHFADYLKGGFDKEYPDHLPPNPRFGTPQEFATFLREARRMGHPVMPYTNPTWWCDDPKGPTFQREGDGPLLRTLEGSLFRERYASNEGYTICFWHPAVQEANRRTRRQFTQEFPVDVLFQDQCGARGWLYDMNPASPTPYAYTEGLLSMVAEDSARVPLSTESGWDWVAEYVSQVSGMGWSLVPTEFAPDWVVLLREQVSTRLWEIFPLAQFLAHHKAAMTLHNLGQSVTNREVLAWVLGLGFALIARVSAPSLAQDAPREWLRWLSRLQQSVCARYIGERLRAFRHERTGEGDGLLWADYGRVQVVANLNPHSHPVQVGSERVTLAPFGFHASGEGMVAANLHQVAGREFPREGVSFVLETAKGRDLWVYARAGEELAIPLPRASTGRAHLMWDGGTTTSASIQRGTLFLEAPAETADATIVRPPSHLAHRAPQDWSRAPLRVGVLSLPGLAPVWTDIAPQLWLETLQRWTRERRAAILVEPVRSVDDLLKALEEGAQTWFAIVNPYGEVFPTRGAGGWSSMLKRIRHYVRHGGIWWETGGYSFHIASYPYDGTLRQEAIGGQGMDLLGLPIGGGPVEQAPEPLQVTEEGRKWLGDALARRISGLRSAVNRGLPRSEHAPVHVGIVSGRRDDFIGGYRLDGWGWLWRVGGLRPNPDVVLPVAIAILERLYIHPPVSVSPGGVRRVWHARISA